MLAQLSALDMINKPSLQDSPAVTADGLDEMISFEDQSLFSQYLIHLQDQLPHTVKESGQAPHAEIPRLILPQVTSGTIFDSGGKELPFGGNQLPSLTLVSVAKPVELPNILAEMDAAKLTKILPVVKSVELPNSLVFGAAPLAAINNDYATMQLREFTLDLHSSPPRMEQALGNRIMWMVGQNMQVAELRIHPPHLGPLQVHISVEPEQTNVSFITQHAEVREVMEHTIPRLRHILTEAGLNPANVDISQQDLSQRQQSAGHDSSPPPDGPDSPLKEQFDGTQDMHTPWPSKGIGLIDYFA